MVGRGCISDTSIPFSPVDQHWGAHAHYRHVASTEWNPDQEGCCLYSCIPISLAEAIQVNHVLNQIVLPYVLALAAWFAFLTPSMPPSCLIRLPLPDCSLKGLNFAMYVSIFLTLLILQNSWKRKEFSPLLNPVQL